jgi:hypothetical protein
MENRRQFLKSVTALGVASVVGVPAGSHATQAPPSVLDSTDDRGYWVAVMGKIANPVLENLARRQLKKTMPVEAALPSSRSKCTHLEAFLGGCSLASRLGWRQAG